MHHQSISLIRSVGSPGESIRASLLSYEEVWLEESAAHTFWAVRFKFHVFYLIDVGSNSCCAEKFNGVFSSGDLGRQYGPPFAQFYSTNPCLNRSKISSTYILTGSNVNEANDLTHFSASGRARMVDVSEKVGNSASGRRQQGIAYAACDPGTGSFRQDGKG